MPASRPGDALHQPGHPAPHPLGDDKSSLLPPLAPSFVLGIFLFPKGKPNRDPPPCSCCNNYRKQQALFLEAGESEITVPADWVGVWGATALRVKRTGAPCTAKIEAEDFPAHTPHLTQTSYCVENKSPGLKQFLIQKRKPNVCVQSRIRRPHVDLIKCCKNGCTSVTAKAQTPCYQALARGCLPSGGNTVLLSPDKCSRADNVTCRTDFEVTRMDFLHLLCKRGKVFHLSQCPLLKLGGWDLSLPHRVAPAGEEKFHSCLVLSNEDCGRLWQPLLLAGVLIPVDEFWRLWVRVGPVHSLTNGAGRPEGCTEEQSDRAWGGEVSAWGDAGQEESGGSLQVLCDTESRQQRESMGRKYQKGAGWGRTFVSLKLNINKTALGPMGLTLSS